MIECLGIPMLLFEWISGYISKSIHQKNSNVIRQKAINNNESIYFDSLGTRRSTSTNNTVFIRTNFETGCYEYVDAKTNQIIEMFGKTDEKKRDELREKWKKNDEENDVKLRQEFLEKGYLVYTGIKKNPVYNPGRISVYKSVPRSTITNEELIEDIAFKHYFHTSDSPLVIYPVKKIDNEVKKEWISINQYYLKRIPENERALKIEALKKIGGII